MDKYPDKKVVSFVSFVVFFLIFVPESVASKASKILSNPNSSKAA